MKKLFPWLSFLVLTALFMVALFYNKTVIGYHSGTLPFELNRIGGIGGPYLAARSITLLTVQLVIRLIYFIRG
ncbi:hypothetical protein [Lentilactobacillus senioris]|uniref:hypothetical protein n=1 Tax=Lentilactobacillus senioris TaxID=931534 RepID=UPI0006D171A8|nr:hypothetical protein [Lentilactobacillus senioris]